MNRREMLAGLAGAVVLPGIPITAVATPLTVQPLSMAGAKLFSYREDGVEVAYIDLKGVLYVMDVKNQRGVAQR